MVAIVVASTKRSARYRAAGVNTPKKFFASPQHGRRKPFPSQNHRDQLRSARPFAYGIGHCRAAHP